ncbi:TssN family type VI secretion system protein [Plebeiibacterium sediminum]|uniref:TssN family type VI secretion system protein n=1 Tax=Plebeiibacterium sediminum TaxID=2992112 RepID=A0AAE3M868_9BACT|nr:TssN family type VI secretion system protein [Plebeiobacterium sediminum]MCW3788873.1 TssN family type VI secretion system protein [Plebeiobacterium sediminum]
MIIKSLLNGDIQTISIIMFLFGAAIIAFIKEIKKLITKDKKKTIIYLLVSALAFSILSVFSIENIISKPFTPNYITLQALSLIFGIIHVYALNNVFTWENNNKWLAQVLFSLIVVLVGSIIFLQLAGYWGIKNLHYLFLTGTFTFMLPWIFKELFESAMRLPLAVYKKWEYPIQSTHVQPKLEELKNPTLIKLEMSKHFKEKNVSRFTVKAPENMDFGKFFYHFINDYNQKHPESTIEYKTAKGSNEFGWIFYRKPRFIGSWKMINVDQTITRNSIKENHCIVCERVF